MALIAVAAAGWQKSSRSAANGGECVEVAVLPSLVAVRDSKATATGMLAVPPGQWQAFIAGVQRGVFDQ